MKHLSFLLPAVLLSATPNAEIAEPDGYFCFGPRYLAYEVGVSISPKGHRLYIVPFNIDAREIRIREVSIPEFQTYEMRCGESSVILLGPGTKHEVSWNHLYEIAHNDSLRKETLGHNQSPKPEFWNFISDSHRDFELVEPDKRTGHSLTIKRRGIPDLQCMELVTAYLHKFDWDLELDSRVLYSREVPTECHE